jgi:hypothetical protein
VVGGWVGLGLPCTSVLCRTTTRSALHCHDTCGCSSLYLLLHLHNQLLSQPVPMCLSAPFCAALRCLSWRTRTLVSKERFDRSDHCARSIVLPTIFFGFRSVLYGSDFPVTHLRGRCVGVGDSFLWISPGNCDLKAAYAEHGEIQTALVRAIQARRLFRVRVLRFCGALMFSWLMCAGVEVHC